MKDHTASTTSKKRPAESSSSNGQQRRNNGGYRHRHHKNPSRGGPAILLTCEQGREKKCEREGIEILRHYWECTQEETSKSGVQVDLVEAAAASSKKVSLDDELELLRTTKSGKTNDNSFQTFDTGCKGTVVIMCTLPNCNLIPAIVKKDDENNTDTAATTITVPDSKKPRTETDMETGSTRSTANTSTSESPPPSPPWDPIQTVRDVVQDLVSSSSSSNHHHHAPGSRFVTRMIPIQATCYASLAEIQQVVDFLLDRLLPTLAPPVKGEKPQSFGITFKRRNCSLLKRDAVIEALAALVVGRTSWSVKLREPDFTVMVEVCKTLCGISILHSSFQTVAPNFNLATLRAKEGAASE